MVSRLFKSLGMEQPVDKILIKKFIAGECSQAEELAVNYFLKQPDGEALFNLVMQQQWEDVADFEVEAESLQEWKSDLKGNLGIQEEGFDEPRLYPVKNYFIRYAAIWIFAVLGIGVYGIFSLKTSTHSEQKIAEAIEVKANPYGRRSSFLLSDSTKVFLGAGSKLFYPKRFSGDRRTIRLVGEAFFQVTKNPKKPFIVYTGEVRTMVLGTSFKINAFAGKPLSVAVATGKVRVDHLSAHRQHKSLGILTPGLMLTYNQETANISKMAIDDTEKWAKGLLVFKGIPLSQLTEEISRWYNVTIRLKRQSLKSMPVTVTLDANVPINKLLDGLCVIGSLKYKFKNKNEIVIY